MLKDTLVSAEWLREHLHDVRVVDIRGYVRSEALGGGRQKATYTGAHDEYLQGHIPGAVYVDWTRDIVDPTASVKAQIANPEQFAVQMQKLGIGNDTDVVIADHAGGHFATRLWWALKYYGHDSVALLDGGYKRWTELGFPLETATPEPSPATFIPSVRPDLVRDANQVLSDTTEARRQLVDARDSATFNGTVQRGSRGGHIPGAVNVPIANFVGENGLWKSPESIREVAEAHGVDLNQPVTAYCNGGVTATAALFAFHRAGLGEISNYDGSWNEWGENPDLPVEGNQDLFSKPEG